MDTSQSLPRTALSLGPCDSFTELSARYLSEYGQKISASLLRLSEEQIWWRPDDSRANSVGNLVVHLEGNLRAWILVTLAGESHERHRSAEFTCQLSDGAPALTRRLEVVVARCLEVLRAFDDRELIAPREHQGYATNALGVILHAVEHMAYHTGQIVWITKRLTDPSTTAEARLEFYPQHASE